jgi:nucleoside-diphosphate-sugar epimerase
MKLLITGATGFIGYHLTQRLLKEGHTLFAIIRPSTKKEDLAESISTYNFDGDCDNLVSFMRQEKFDGVIHLASLFLAQHTPHDIPNLINSNILFSTSILEACSSSQTPWFINTGTFWQHNNNKQYSPVNLYAATKEAFETMARYYIETTTLNFVTLQLSDTFGPHDTRKKVVNLWMEISKTGQHLDMSPGEQLIDISYIENVVDAYMHTINLIHKDTERDLCGTSFAISSLQVMSLKNLAHLFEETTGSKLNITWGGKDYRPREVMTPWNKGEMLPGWKPPYTLTEGIKKIFGTI